MQNLNKAMGNGQRNSPEYLGLQDHQKRSERRNFVLVSIRDGGDHLGQHQLALLV